MITLIIIKWNIFVFLLVSFGTASGDTGFWDTGTFVFVPLLVVGTPFGDASGVLYAFAPFLFPFLAVGTVFFPTFEFPEEEKGV